MLAGLRHAYKTCSEKDQWSQTLCGISLATCLHACTDSIFAHVQPVQVMKSHVHLQGSDVPATIADGPLAPSCTDAHLLDVLACGSV